MLSLQSCLVEKSEGSSCLSCKDYLIDVIDNNKAYGELYGHEIGDTIITNQSFYTNVTGFSNGDCFNTVAFNNTITILDQGVYHISAQFSFSDGANTEFHIAAGINGQRQIDCHAQRKIGTGGDVGSSSFTCIKELNATDIVTLMIENVDNVGDPEIHSVNINLVKIK